jgi:hypothetical protein
MFQNIQNTVDFIQQQQQQQQQWPKYKQIFFSVVS